jgi:hypothetical protein
MVLGIVISTAPPFIVEKVKKRSWVMTHPDKVLVDVEGPSLGALDLEHGEPDGDGADRRDDAKVQTDGRDRMRPNVAPPRVLAVGITQSA